jgi:hypothetical protein
MLTCQYFTIYIYASNLDISSRGNCRYYLPCLMIVSSLLPGVLELQRTLALYLVLFILRLRRARCAKLPILFCRSVGEVSWGNSYHLSSLNVLAQLVWAENARARRSLVQGFVFFFQWSLLSGSC